MRSLLIYSLLAYLSAICTCHIDLDESLSHVSKECSHELTRIDSIKKFEIFMEHYNNVIKEREKPKRGLLNLDKRVRKCYDLQDSLFNLRDLLDKRSEGICQMSFINKLVDFHVNFLLKNATNQDQNVTESKYYNVNSSYVGYLFSLIAHQVAYTCKGKLISRVRAAQSEQDCSYVLSNFLPSSSQEQSDSTDEEVNQVKEFLKNFKRVEDFAPILHQRGSKDPYFNMIVSGEAVTRIEKLKNKCREQAPYYMSLFAPIATLSGLGYEIEESTSDTEDLENSDAKILKCWLAVAQLCQGILRTHLDVEAGNMDEGERKLVEIKFGSPPGDDVATPLDNLLQSEVEFLDNFDEISPNVIETVRHKASYKAKVKRKALLWAKRFIDKHIDVEGRRQEVIGKFFEELSADSDSTDQRVAFAGKRSKHGMYNPATLVTGDTDTFIKLATFFVNNKISLILNSIVAIALSAAFVWFTLYAVVTSLKHGFGFKSDLNFKADWRDLRNKRMKKLDDKIRLRGWKDKFKIYTQH